jgi:uncharacterized protein
MEILHIVLLLVAGVAGGFLAGLVGVGGGVIFSPVLFFFYTAIGTEPALIPPLTLGSSMFCTLMAAASGAQRQLSAGTVLPRIALVVGLFATVAVLAMTFLVTTRPWYSSEVFQVVLAVVLLAAVGRMLVGRSEIFQDDWERNQRTGTAMLASAGLGAGAVASAAGVGGGIVMVPLFNQVMRLPLKVAAATSMATIVIISLSGVVAYVLAGLGADTPGTSLGFVDFGRVVWLAVPAVFAARLGVKTAIRVNVAIIRWAFAALATFVALRLLAESLAIW